MPVPLRFGYLFQDPDRLTQPGPELLVDEGVRLPDPVDRGHLDASVRVPQRGVVPQLGENVAHLRFGQALRHRFLRPSGDDVGVVHLVEPHGLGAQVRAALHHLQLPQRPGRRERRGTGGLERQREGGQAGHFWWSSRSVCGARKNSPAH